MNLSKNIPLRIHRLPFLAVCLLLLLSSGCGHSKDKNPNPDNSGENGGDDDTIRSIQTIRVLSFNIQRGLITDGSTDLDLYADIIKAQKPDIVALSEIDKNIPRSGNVDQTAVLAEKTGMKGYFGKFRDYKGGDWGDAILSKYPVLEFKVIPANSELDPDHAISYIFAKIKIDEDRIIYFNCSHLTPWVEEQNTIQAKELINYYDSALGKAPLLICGDLNAIPTSDAMNELFTQFKPSDPQFLPTYNARTSLTRKIDWILYPKIGDWRVIKYKRILRSDASDHVAILSVLSFNPDK